MKTRTKNIKKDLLSYRMKRRKAKSGKWMYEGSSFERLEPNE
jgi:hypothetical protein